MVVIAAPSPLPTTTILTNRQAMNRLLIRMFDILAGIVGGLSVLPVILILGLLIRRDSPGPALFRQVRLGRHERPFVCLKLRTMAEGTVSMGTHEVSGSAVTSIGRTLRRLKLDELPQLWNVAVGEMSLVGPRPGLPNQLELAQQRRLRGIFNTRPGVTGPGQVNDIDMSTPVELAEMDATYASRPNLRLYFGYIIATVLGRGQGDRLRD